MVRDRPLQRRLLHARYADPYNAIIGGRFSSLSDDAVFHRLLGMFLFSGLLSGTLLVMVRRTVLPVGTLPLVLVLNAVAMNLMYSRGPLNIALPFISVALRVVAALFPVVFWGLYFTAVIFVRGLGWSFTFVSGAVVLCGVVGLLSYVAIPPVQNADAERAT